MDRRFWVDTERSGEQLTAGNPLPGVRLMSARGSTRHWREYHSDFNVALIHAGQDGVGATFRCRNRTHQAGCGDLMLFEPNDVHVTTSVSRSASFSLVTVAADNLTSAAREMGIRGELHFKTSSTSNPVVGAAMTAFIRAVAENEGSFDVECTYATLVRVLLEECVETPAVRLDAVRDYRIRTVREILRKDFSENHCLDDLAREAKISKFWLSHCFEKALGLPPHAYLKLRKACEARRLIERGVPIDHVAALVGYVDVPLLTRTLKSYFGVPPARWRNAFQGNTRAFESVRSRPGR